MATTLALLLLLGPAQTISGKYLQHSKEYLREYPRAPVALPAPLPGGVDELCRLIEAGHATPGLFAALGEALFARGDKELAYRAFRRAHKLGHKDPRRMIARMDACPRVPDKVIASEEFEARVWVDALQSYERARIAAGKDPRDLTEFHERYGRPEDDLNEVIWRRRLTFLGGVAVVIMIVAALVLWMVKSRR